MKAPGGKLKGRIQPIRWKDDITKNRQTKAGWENNQCTCGEYLLGVRSGLSMNKLQSLIIGAWIKQKQTAWDALSWTVFQHESSTICHGEAPPTHFSEISRMGTNEHVSLVCK
jgi:hypothetical protein